MVFADVYTRRCARSVFICREKIMIKTPMTFDISKIPFPCRCILKYFEFYHWKYIIIKQFYNTLYTILYSTWNILLKNWKWNRVKYISAVYECRKEFSRKFSIEIRTRNKKKHVLVHFQTKKTKKTVKIMPASQLLTNYENRLCVF